MDEREENNLINNDSNKIKILLLKEFIQKVNTGQV